MEDDRNRNECDPTNDVLEEYDSVGAAEESCTAIAMVLQSPDVDSGFKQRLMDFAVGRCRSLGELGNYEAASSYRLLIEAKGLELG